jgi:precorrin-3B C17-methyltransferase
VTVRGRLLVVGVGPGHRDLLTPQAAAALKQAEVVIGYAGYFAWILDLIQGKEWIAFPLGQEKERAQAALEHAHQGRQVALISSGDPGIYAMASLVLEMLASVAVDTRPEVVVLPGVSALNAAAALLGAPLGHDFAAISLSDLLTPWEIIEKRLLAAATADFVLALFNPRSGRRDWQLHRAREILLHHRPGRTPVGIVRHATRPGETIVVTSLAEMDVAKVDMFSIVIVGNSTSRLVGNFIMTPRGYEIAEDFHPDVEQGCPD